MKGMCQCLCHELSENPHNGMGTLPVGAYRDGRHWTFYCMACDTSRQTTTRAAVRLVAAAHRHAHPYLDWRLAPDLSRLLDPNLIETQVDPEAFYP